MTLPEVSDHRPYTHPDFPGTWKISNVHPHFIRMRRIEDSYDIGVAVWPGEWALAPVPVPRTEAEEIALGVYRLEDEHHVYAVPSASTDRIHQVTVNTRTGAMRCDGPHCDGRTCSHQRRVLKARAGF